MELKQEQETEVAEKKTHYWSYSSLKEGKKIPVYERRSDLPDGVWVTIAEAAKLMGVSKMTIRYRFLKDEYEGAKVAGGPLLVNIKK